MVEKDVKSVKVQKSNLEKYAKVDKFKPSAVAIDPITQDLYILAAAGQLMVVLNPEYKVKAVKKLSRKTYGQPEGICFSPEGDLYISNEGGDKKSNFYHLIRQPK